VIVAIVFDAAGALHGPDAAAEVAGQVETVSS